MLSLVLHLALFGQAPGQQAAQKPSQATQVTWSAPAGCPSREAIVSGIEVLLGGPLEADRPVTVRAQGRIEQLASDRWTLAIRISSETGTRERMLEGTTCQELGEVAIVLITVAIDPSVDLSEMTPPVDDEQASDGPDDPDVPDGIEEPPDDPVEVLPPVPPSPENAPEASTSSKGLLVGFFDITTGFLVGPLPGVAPGMHVGVGLRWRMLAVAVGMSHWFERRARLPGTSAGGELQLTTGDLRVCAVPSVRRLYVPLCTGVELGALAGRGVGVSNPRAGRGLWAAGLLDAGITYMPWPWVGFGIRSGLVVPLTRPAFTLVDLGEVHRAAPVGFQGLVGFEVRFP